jgi:hypothetical protein
MYLGGMFQGGETAGSKASEWRQAHEFKVEKEKQSDWCMASGVDSGARKKMRSQIGRVYRH